ncbi:hypothetical protein BDZ45DRAFT_810161 [Acephala macrosclerotiorum]|nr:hypothetical protein BDZ45DRAFT_810161 [Acephala macrosclerotiorum]
MGLILIILTFVAFGLCLKRHSHLRVNLAHKINLTILITLAVSMIVTGFVDLSTILCLFQFPPQVIFVITGFLFAILTFSATTMVLMKMGLEKLVCRQTSDGVL